MHERRRVAAALWGGRLLLQLLLFGAVRALTAHLRGRRRDRGVRGGYAHHAVGNAIGLVLEWIVGGADPKLALQHRGGRSAMAQDAERRLVGESGPGGGRAPKRKIRLPRRVS
jgi:hypothetical protein